MHRIAIASVHSADKGSADKWPQHTPRRYSNRINDHNSGLSFMKLRSYSDWTEIEF